MADGDVRKSRNLERRRETSRYAARDRRGKEADIFNDLKDVVPLVDDNTVTHLDRIALLRVAVTLCRLKKTAGNVLESKDSQDDDLHQHTEDMLTECLDGFVMIVDSDGTILYVTESVMLFLGLTQTDLSGRILKEFLYPQDYETFCQLSTECNGENADEFARTAVLRLKTVISPRGRTLNLKSALFKPVSFTVHGKRSTGGHVLLMQASTIPAGQGSLASAAQNSTKMSDQICGTFMTRHTCDMRVSYASDKLSQFIHKEPRSLIGTSFYDLVHPEDIDIVAECIKELLIKGHIRTPYYRLISPDGTSIWVTSEASTVAHTTKGTKGQYIICLHCVLGTQTEGEELIVCTESDPNGLLCQRVKEEFSDELAEYEGRQPEIIECVNFTSLVDADEFEKLNPIDMPTPISSSSRKSSYDEVLQWLFLDKPHSPAPAMRSSHNGSGSQQPVRNPYKQQPSHAASSRQSGTVDIARRAGCVPISAPDHRRHSAIAHSATRLVGAVGDRLARVDGNHQHVAGRHSANRQHHNATTAPSTPIGVGYRSRAASAGRIDGGAVGVTRPVATYRSPVGARGVPTVPTSGSVPLRERFQHSAMQSTMPSANIASRQYNQQHSTNQRPQSQSLRSDRLEQSNNTNNRPQLNTHHQQQQSNDLNHQPRLQQQKPQQTVLFDDLEWEEPDLSFYAPYIESADSDQQLSTPIQPLQFCDPPLDFFDKFIHPQSSQQQQSTAPPPQKHGRFDNESVEYWQH